MIRFTCMKIANQSGDVRTGLNILHSAISELEKDYLKSVKGSSIASDNISQPVLSKISLDQNDYDPIENLISNCSSVASPARSNLASNMQQLKILTMPIINKVMESNYTDIKGYFGSENSLASKSKVSINSSSKCAKPKQPNLSVKPKNTPRISNASSSSSSSDDEQTLPLQQALIVLAIYKTTEKHQRNEVEFSWVDPVYMELCKRASIGKSNLDEVWTMIENICDHGLLSVRKVGKNQNKWKLGLKDEEEKVRSIFRDKVMLEKLLLLKF